MNVFWYDPKVVSKHACIVDVAVAYTEPETGCVVILLIQQTIEMKGIDYHCLCPMQCCMNGVLIDRVPKFLAPITSEIMHPMQLENVFDATQPNIIPLKLKGVTSYIKVRTPTQEEHENQNIIKIELMFEAPPWDLSSPELNRQNQNIFDYRRQFVSIITPAREQLFINSVTCYAYDAADVMDNDNYAAVLEKFSQYLVVVSSTS